LKLKKMIDKTLALYLLVGVLNFIVCTGIMFLLYNVADVSKHFAPIVNYGLGSIIWYLSCNYLLFPGHKTTSKQLLCFVLDVVVVLSHRAVCLAPAAALALRDALLLVRRHGEYPRQLRNVRWFAQLCAAELFWPALLRLQRPLRRP